MSVKHVLVWPDEGLRVVASPVQDLTDPEVKQAAEDLRDTMKAYNAQGIAATQIGVPLRMLAYREQQGSAMVLVNPRVVSSEGSVNSAEGCLSFPGVSVKLRRAESIEIEAQTMFGDTVQLSLRGLEAVAIQHELDHLNGVVFLDHLDKLGTRMALKRLKKVKKRLGAYAMAVK